MPCRDMKLFLHGFSIDAMAEAFSFTIFFILHIFFAVKQLF